jgi:hypothetical protein
VNPLRCVVEVERVVFEWRSQEQQNVERGDEGKGGLVMDDQWAKHW